MATTMSEPPYYILVSQSPLSAHTPGAPSTALCHPVIQYHYADDSPLSLLPQTPGEHVLVLDYDPASPTAKSISKTLAVTTLKVAEAPGASAAESESNKNGRMYILETTTTLEDKTGLDGSQSDIHNPQAILALFKQRNAVLRRALLNPDIPKPALQRDPSPA